MPHRNKIIDSDAFFEVNAITRQIANKTPSKITLMQNDHNSERFTFSVPRFIEGHDMLEVDKAEVHFLNGESDGIYEMKDLAIDPKDENKVICSWLLTNNATKNVGLLNFSLKFTCYADDGITPNYVWNTVIFSGISISESLDNSGTVAENHVDVLEQWRQEFIQKEEKNVAGGVAGLDENGKIPSEHIPAGSGGSITVDDALSETSENPVQNKVVNSVLQQLINNKTGVGHTHTISELEDYTVDDALSETSTNPVQNKVITEAINDINENAITNMLWMDLGDGWELHFLRKDEVPVFPKTKLTSPEQVQEAIDNAIGDIETALENIITKYGLGGDSV